jgi:hypothetical protein
VNEKIRRSKLAEVITFVTFWVPLFFCTSLCRQYCLLRLHWPLHFLLEFMYTASTINYPVFWDVMLCILMNFNRCFSGIHSLHLQGGRLNEARSKYEANFVSWVRNSVQLWIFIHSLYMSQQFTYVIFFFNENTYKWIPPSLRILFHIIEHLTFRKVIYLMQMRLLFYGMWSYAVLTEVYRSFEAT